MMAPIIPIVGGQYRFKAVADDESIRMGVFVHFSAEDGNFIVHQYVEAFTSPNDVPENFIGLCGLPDLKRDEKNPRLIFHVDEIIILDKLYICKNKLFQQRVLQWRLGMRNLYRICDDELDEECSFIGFDEDDGDPDKYINQEHDYLIFKMNLVMVSKPTYPFATFNFPTYHIYILYS